MAKFILLLALLLTKESIGQKKIEIGLSLGNSTPLGNFGCENCNNGGFAKGSESIQLSANYPIYKKFKLTTSIMYQRNKLDNNSLVAYYKAENPSSQWYTETDNYNSYGLFCGLKYEARFFKRLSFEPRFQLGIFNANSPTVYAEAKNNIFGESWLKLYGERKFMVAYLMGSDLSFDVSEKFFIISYFEFLTAQTDYNNLNVEYSDGRKSNENYSQNIMSINYGIGLGYRIIWKK